MILGIKSAQPYNYTENIIQLFFYIIFFFYLTKVSSNAKIDC